MKAITTFLQLILIYTIQIGLLFFYIFGIVHTYKKHSKMAFASSFIPPVGIYWGIETFWHEDKKEKDNFSNVDWNKRMKGDVYILYRLLASNPEENKMSEFNETLEVFSKRVMSYPTEKIDYLKEAARKYGRYLQATNKDFTNYFEEYLSGEEISDQIWSKNSKPILDSIISEYEIDELSTSYAEIDSSIQILSNSATPLDEEKIDKKIFFNNMKKLISGDMYRINRIFKMIFNEEMGLNQSI